MFEPPRRSLKLNRPRCTRNLHTIGIKRHFTQLKVTLDETAASER